MSVARKTENRGGSVTIPTATAAAAAVTAAAAATTAAVTTTAAVAATAATAAAAAAVTTTTATAAVPTTAAAAVAASAAATAAAVTTAATATAFLTRARFVDRQGTAVDVFAVDLADGIRRVLLGCHGDEREPAGLARDPVLHEENFGHGANGTEQVL